MARTGPPPRTDESGGTREHDFGAFVLRFQGRPPAFAEASFLPTANVTWKGRSVFEDRDVFGEMLAADGRPMECVGFVVLLELGVAMTGFHDGAEEDKAVTVFARGTWDHLRAEMKPLAASAVTR